MVLVLQRTAVAQIGGNGTRVIGTAQAGLLYFPGAPTNMAKASRQGERARVRLAMAMRQARWHNDDGNMRLSSQ